MNCADCGKPVHLSNFTCEPCHVRTWFHDSPADAQYCPGTGPHVQAAAA